VNAVILCAGFATRMAPLTENFPKPLLPVADRPVIDYLIDQLAEMPQISTVHIVTNARYFTHFLRWREQYRRLNRRRTAALEIYNDGATANENRLGAVADLQLVLETIGYPSRVLVSAGDNIYRFKLGPLWDEFLKGDHHRIVALPETDESRLKKTGVVELGTDARVLRFHEKPQRPNSNWRCPPLYFFQDSVAIELEAFLASSENRDAPGNFIAYLCRQRPVYAFRLVATSLDIGSIDAYRRADRLLRQHPV
jgi:glucose-1-phosphate thymidylyltransferase